MNNFILNKKIQTLRIYLLLAVCLLAYGYGFSQDTPQQVGNLSFETETIDYGTILQNTNGKRTFMFTNTGNAPIVISNIKTSCGCTVPNYPKMPILPSETATIDVTYDTHRVGVFNKTITVISNASEPLKTLKIKGNIKKEVTTLAVKD